MTKLADCVEVVTNNENCVVNLEGAQNYVALDLDKLRVEPINNHFEIEKRNSIILFENNEIRFVEKNDKIVFDWITDKYHFNGRTNLSKDE